MTTPGFGRDNPFRLSGGPFTPAQREQVERVFIENNWGTTGVAHRLDAAKNPPVSPTDNYPTPGSGWKWEWVETRTFPDSGKTYDVVGAMIGFPDAAHNELWFDVTSTLAPEEKGPLVIRAITTPVVKHANGATRPAGQTNSGSSGVIPTLLILGALAGFTALEYFFRPPPRPLSPVRRRRRKSVMLPV